MRILILDDNDERIIWFKQYFPEADIAKDAKEGITKVTTREYDLIFLDHDLWRTDELGEEDNNNGYEVAKALVRSPRNRKAEIVIHSMNFAGAQRMKNLLPQARYIPFYALNFKK